MDDIRDILVYGEIIENYANDYPYPSRLLLGWRDNRPIHLVVALNQEEEEWIVITVYEPDEERWEPGFKRRKK